MGGEMAQQQAEPDSHDSKASTLTTPIRKPAPPKRKPKKLPPFRVLLHNDDENTFDHVIKSVRRLTTLSSQEAQVKAVEAHDTGVALLLVTHRERAELYVEQFASLSVTVTAEPAEG